MGKKSGKPVEVYLLKETGGMKKLCVRDYGIGMTKDILLQKYFVIGESSKKDSPLNFGRAVWNRCVGCIPVGRHGGGQDKTLW